MASTTPEPAATDRRDVVPYVITVTRPVAPDDDGQPFCAACSHYHEDACLCPDCGRPTPCRTHSIESSVSTPATDISRRAVATLDEAQAAVVSAYETRTGKPAPACFALREDGGTTGPLPDGTTIEVERRGLNYLHQQAKGCDLDAETLAAYRQSYTAEIIAAFNEASA